MFEAKLTIVAPGLEAALNNLAAAISGAKLGPVTAPPAAPAMPVQPTGNPAPATPTTGPAAASSNIPNPTPAAPSAAPAPTAAPAAPTGGPTSAFPSNNPIPTAAPLPGPAPQPAAPTGFPAGAPLPTSPGPQYTVDQIMQAGATLMDAGKAGELMNLLASFNVPAVTALKPEQLGAFATALRQLGAQI